ncbi:TPA: chemotaxis protein CheB [Pseudomonas aeruginosa]
MMRVGVVSTSNVQVALIKEVLEPIVGEMAVYDLSHADSGELSSTSVHALIVDFSDAGILQSEDVLEMVNREEPVCVLNERELYTMSPPERQAWCNKIVEELKSSLPDLAESLDANKAEIDSRSANDTWVVGCSSGGPQAIRDFLSDLPTLPVSIFLVQHLTEAAFNTYVHRVSECTSCWEVMAAEHGAKVRAGAIFVVPRDQTVEVRGGTIQLRPVKPNAYSPSINSVVRSVYSSIPGKLGVIILTGMGDDGASAVRELKGKLKVVMAQDAESSQARSMPDAARETGVVSYSGKPSDLARQMTSMYSDGE